jgi:GAF domain-containing protein
MIDFGDQTDAFVASLHELAGLLIADETLVTLLDRVVTLACSTVPNCDYASVTYMEGSVPSTPAASNPIAAQIDQAQYEDDSGPCLDAFRRRRIVSVPSITDGEGWEGFRANARAHGVRSSLSLPMVSRSVDVGALNLYGRESGSFTDVAHESALRFAAQAAVAVANARTYDETREVVRNLESALDRRDVIGQAKGIIMANEKVAADEAFSLLREASQTRNVKLRDLAVEVAETRITPRLTQ